MKRLAAQIPNGFLAGDSWVRQAEIRELNGFDEQHLAFSQSYFPPFRTTLLLERVVSFSSSPKKLDLHETVRNLPVGDRVALILHLQKITFGDVLHCMLQCPSCKEQLSIDISVDSLLQPANPNSQTAYPFELEGFALKVRPVSGLDLEAIALDKNVPNPEEKLLRSCILFSEPPLPETLSSRFLEQIGTKLAEIDLQSDLTLNVNCPACSKGFQAPLDIEDFFFQEVAGRYHQLEREVHWIAFHYHWSEKAILSLPMSKRKRYVELINTTLAGESV